MALCNRLLHELAARAYGANCLREAERSGRYVRRVFAKRMPGGKGGNKIWYGFGEDSEGRDGNGQDGRLGVFGELKGLSRPLEDEL